MSPGSPATRPARRRPAPVTILAGIQFVAAGGYLLLAVLILLTGQAPEGVLVAEVALVFVAGLQALAAILLLRLARLGWTLTMLLTGFSLLTQIVSFAQTREVSGLTLLLAVVTVLYLNQRQVRAAFGHDLGVDGSAIEESTE